MLNLLIFLSSLQTCRWTALLVGIWWGNKRWQANKATEDEHRAYLAKMQPIWDAEKAEKAAKVRMLLFLWTCIQLFTILG